MSFSEAEARIRRLSARLQQAEYRMAVAQDQALRTRQGVAGFFQVGADFGREPCVVANAHCATDGIPCQLTCLLNFVGGFFNFANQTIPVEWEGAGNPTVWSGCAVINFTGSGACVSGTAPVKLTLTIPNGSSDPSVLINYINSGGCPQPGTCASSLTSSFLLSTGGGMTFTLACSPFDLAMVQGPSSAEFTPA
jgi:hypothetical protein